MCGQLERQIEHLQSSHNKYVQAAENAKASREEHWKNEAQKLQKLNENDAARIKQFEAERSKLSHFKRDMDTLVARNSELEDKIKRQEQYMKTRLLRDRGSSINNRANVLSGSGEVPEGCAKPKPLVGGHRHEYSSTAHHHIGGGHSNQL